MSNDNPEIIAERFDTTEQMANFLGSEEKMKELKKRYPPGEYSATLNLVEMKVVVKKN